MLMKKRKGAVALITILVISAVLLSVGITLSAIGHNEVVLSGVFRDGETAFAIADACAEEGLSRLKQDSGFTGTTFTIDGGTCSVTVTNISGNTYRILGTGEFKDNIRIIDANVTIKFNGQGNAKTVKINAWVEAD